MFQNCHLVSLCAAYIISCIFGVYNQNVSVFGQVLFPITGFVKTLHILACMGILEFNANFSGVTVTKTVTAL